MDLFHNLIDIFTLENILHISTQIVTIASIVTATTPTPGRDTILSKLYHFIEFLALVTDKAKQPPKG